MRKNNNKKIELLRRYRYRKHLRRLANRTRYIPKSTEQKPNTIIYEEIAAPEDFDFIKNTDQLLTYFECGREFIRKGNNVKFNLKDVKKLSPSGIAVYVSYFNDPSFAQGKSIVGNSPTDPYANKIFSESGFFDHVNCRMKYKASAHNFLIHKLTNKKVETDIAKKATDFAGKYIFNKKIFRPIYEVIIELMANTNNHAAPDSTEIYNWWMFMSYDRTTKVASYSFLDHGVGIFKSKAFLNYVKIFGLNVYSTPQSLEKMAKDLLAGEISSKTGLQERGRGLPTIIDHAKKPEFKEFFIISNNIYIDVKSEKTYHLASEFFGTFVYWEIQNDNQNCY